MPLDARIEAEKLRQLYYDDPRQQSFNLLLLGDKGVGKTSLLKTARKPVHVDSFENGGTTVLRDEIAKGDIIVDTRYENENPWDPHTFREWRTQFEYKEQNKYFESFGTYCLDSCSAWADAIMWYQLKAANAAAEIPVFQRDYKPQRTLMENWLERMLKLPCDFILTGHLTPRYEEQRVALGNDKFEMVDKIVAYDLAATGQGKAVIPRKFSEMWVMQATTGVKGIKYSLLTERKGVYIASTRIGQNGRLATEEVPNIKEILKKCGLQWKDKPSLFEQPKAASGKGK